MLFTCLFFSLSLAGCPVFIHYSRCQLRHATPYHRMSIFFFSSLHSSGTTVMIDWSGFSPRGVMARLDLYLVNVSSGGYRILDTLPLHNVVRSEEDIINGTMHVSLPPEIPDGQYIFELRGTLAPGSDQQWTRFISCHSVNFHLNGAKLQPRDLDAPKLVLDRFKSNVVPVLWDLFNPGNLIDTVRLFIHCVDSGKEFEIADNIGNSGKYKWVVSLEIPSGFYRLHVRPSHRDTGNVVSLTTSTFEIMNPIIPDPNRQIDDAVAIEYIAIGCTLFFIVFLTLAVCVCRDDKKEVDVFDKSSLLLPDDKLNPDSKTSHISPSHTFQHHHSSHNRHHGGQHPSHAHVNGHVNAHREMFPEGKYNHHNLHRPFLRHQGGAY